MKTLYQKYKDGDNLTDSEVLEGVNVFTDAYLATWKLGPEFRIMAQEIVRMSIAFSDYAIARGLKTEGELK